MLRILIVLQINQIAHLKIGIVQKMRVDLILQLFHLRFPDQQPVFILFFNKTLQSFRHVIELLHEISHIIAPMRLNPDAEIAAADLIHRAGQTEHRKIEHNAEKNADHQNHRHRHGVDNLNAPFNSVHRTHGNFHRHNQLFRKSVTVLRCLDQKVLHSLNLNLGVSLLPIRRIRIFKKLFVLLIKICAGNPLPFIENRHIARRKIRTEVTYLRIEPCGRKIHNADSGCIMRRHDCIKGIACPVAGSARG